MPHPLRRKRTNALLAVLVALAALAASTSTAGAVVAGGGYTTFDAVLGGCLTGANPNGVNCNHYASKGYVFTNGGPKNSTLTPGDYFFAVITPGEQNGGYVDGADGNLSDDVDAAGDNDDGIGDPVANRKFRVQNNGNMQYLGEAGTHLLGTSPTGKKVVGVGYDGTKSGTATNYAFDDTDNPGGVYILAICTYPTTDPDTNALVWPTPDGCKYDAFKAPEGTDVCTENCGPDPFAVMSGSKFYDANADGVWDPAEVGIPGWQVNWVDGTSGSTLTDAQGDYSISVAQLATDTFTLTEGQPSPVAGVTWHQTTPSGTVVPSGVSADPGSNVTTANGAYSVELGVNGLVSGLDFGNYCTKNNTGGYTLGFWSNKNGQALLKANDPAWQAVVNSAPLVKANGSTWTVSGTFTQAYTPFRTWLLNATATNMAYMLSVQLAVTKLDDVYSTLDTSGLVYVAGQGWKTIADVIALATASLNAAGGTNTVAQSALRTEQETYKNILDALNNNVGQILQGSYQSCGTIAFP